MPIYYPDYNYFVLSIKSILSQSYKNIELIIVSDGNSLAIDKYINSLKDNRIRFFKNNTRLGFKKSLNYGISLSNGNYIARQDSDDISLSDRFIKQIEYLKHRDDFLVGTDSYIIDDDNKILGIRIYPHSYDEIKNNILKYNPFAHSSVMLKKSIFKSNMYNVDLNHSEDYDLWLRIAYLYKCENINEKLVMIRNRSGSLKHDVRTLLLQDLVLRVKYSRYYSRDFRFFFSLLLSTCVLLLPNKILMKIFNILFSTKYFQNVNGLRFV